MSVVGGLLRGSFFIHLKFDLEYFIDLLGHLTYLCFHHVSVYVPCIHDQMQGYYQLLDDHSVQLVYGS